MKWTQRFDKDDEVPESLRDKTPAEVAAALQETEGLKQQLADAKKASDDATAARVALQNDFDQQKTRLTELEGRSQQKTTEELEAERLAAEPPSPWLSPEKFVADQTKGVANVALNAGLMAAKMYFMQNLASRDQKIFKKYEKEVEAVVATFAPEARVMPQSWMNGLLYVKGLHEQDISKAESTGTEFFSEGASRSGGEREPEVNDKLTEEESAMCKAMHWDEAGYLKRKKEMTLSQSSKGSYARFSTTAK